MQQEWHILLLVRLFVRVLQLLVLNINILNYDNNMTQYFIINASNHKQYFIANRVIKAIMEYKYINRIDKKAGIELYFDDATFNELYYIENSITKWLVIYMMILLIKINYW